MPAPALSGTTLKAASLLSRTRAGMTILGKIADRDLGLQALIELGLPEASDPAQLRPKPWQAAAPRAWEDQRLAPIEPRPGTAAALRLAYAEGTLSPEHALELLLQRVARGAFGEATWSPFVAMDPDRAREAALESGRRWREGRPLGPLDGVPVPIKDEHDMVGMVTRMGTAFPRPPATTDGFLIRRLRAGGAVLPGKTHLPELGATPIGTNAHYDLPRNVWSRKRGAGGSSTGSAVAVALGLGPVAIGSDAGGSIRIPAALNGIFGLKPTFVRIGRTGNPLGLVSLPHLGPLGASVRDLVDLMEVAAGEADPDDADSQHAPDLEHAPHGWRAALGRGVRGCKIGVPRAEWADADREVASAGLEALRALERDGATLVDVDLPLSSRALSALAVLLLHESNQTLGGEIDTHHHLLGIDLGLSVRLSALIPPEAIEIANRARLAIRREHHAALLRCDVLAEPTTATTAPLLPRREGRVALADLGTTRKLTRFCAPTNLAGLPAGTAPVGMSAGLPVGLQIIGDAWDEASVLAVMAHCERLGLCDLPRPPGWAPIA